MIEGGEHFAEVVDLSVEFHTGEGTVRAVRGVSWHLDRGETLAVLGESGSGKSVSAAAFMGLIDSPPGYITSGRIRFDGEDLLRISTARRREINGRRIGMIFQDTLAALNPVYSVGWQVAETFRLHGMSAAEAGSRALAMLQRVGIPDAARRSADYPHQFSGGQRQRIMIAMALGLRPDLLIADEPTTALDVTVQAQILALLKELQEETGMALMLITHDIGVVAEVADRIAVMKDGQIVESGTVDQVLNAPKHEYVRQLLEAVPGRRPTVAHGVTEENEVLLDVRDVQKFYPHSKHFLRRESGGVVRGLDGISFRVSKGETVAVVGESGSGKSTLARVLLRLTDAASGTALYRGKNIFDLSDAELVALRRNVQAVFQDPAASLNPRMSVGEIIAEPWVIHPEVLPPGKRVARVAELLSQVGLLPAHAKRYPHQFSGGQQQRIAIARALALNPELIICDEAVSSLDVSVQAQVIALLKRLQRNLGLSYIFIAHDLAVVRDFADRVLVMHRGKIVEQGTTKEVFDRPQDPYTRQLMASSPGLRTGKPAQDLSGHAAVAPSAALGDEVRRA